MPNEHFSTQTHKPRFIGISEVQHRISHGKSWIYAKIKSDEFPKPIRVGTSKSIRWIEADIDEWIAAQISATRNTTSQIPNTYGLD
jgi:prophage regulatory protein